jgi:hypothetical protein
MALSRWDNEGGAGTRGPRSSIPDTRRADIPSLTNTESVHLRARVIALENLMIAMLAQASDRQIELIREMATYISPREGFTHHPLTIQATGDMIQLVERASHFRVIPPP